MSFGDHICPDEVRNVPLTYNEGNSGENPTEFVIRISASRQHWRAGDWRAEAEFPLLIEPGVNLRFGRRFTRDSGSRTQALEVPCEYHVSNARCRTSRYHSDTGAFFLLPVTTEKEKRAHVRSLT